MDNIDMDTYVSEIAKSLWDPSLPPLEEQEPLLQFQVRESAMEIGMICLKAMEKARKSDPGEVPDSASAEFDDMLKKFMGG